MLQMLGHEVRAPQSCSLTEKVALGREGQAVQHRALRLQIRLAPQNDALACAPARRELGIWALSGTGAARVGRGGLNCLEADAFWRGLWQAVWRGKTILPLIHAPRGKAQCDCTYLA